MTKLERLIQNYARYVALPWNITLSAPQRIWFAVYDKMDERRLRARVEEFELATKRAQKGWRLMDLTDAFADWMSGNEYRDSYFESPEDLDLTMDEFLDTLVERVKTELESEREDVVVALLGASSLFGFLRVSVLIERIQSHVHGRLLVFFPGEYEQKSYRLLDARDGWNYLAVPITCHDRELMP